MNQRPIGLYDSGAGGLSVLRALHRLLPHESFVYVADTARFPYGEKTSSQILAFNREIIRFLRHAYDVKAIVAACNTSSALALPQLQPQMDLPLFGMIEAGAQATIGRRCLGLIATRGTIRSGAYRAAIAHHNRGCTVRELACPQLVTLAEAVDADFEGAVRVTRRALAPLLRQDMEAILLGCTHYPLLEGPIRRVIGPEVALIDPAHHLALQVSRTLRNQGMLNPGARPGYCHFIATGPAHHLEILVDRYLRGLATPSFGSGRLPAVAGVSVA